MEDADEKGDLETRSCFATRAESTFQPSERVRRANDASSTSANPRLIFWFLQLTRLRVESESRVKAMLAADRLYA
jgi:hypothetical protein